MLRLGTRPDSTRTSPAAAVIASSVCAGTMLIETGTSWMFSTRRWAVTSTASSVTADGRATVDASWARAASGEARASASSGYGSDGRHDRWKIITDPCMGRKARRGTRPARPPSTARAAASGPSHAFTVR